MLVVLGLISILATIATVTLGSSSERAYVAAMQSDLRMVAAAQETYIEQTFAETGTATYANGVSKLDVNLSTGVQIRLRGNRTGWSARATHQRIQGQRCAVYRGTIKAFPPATEEGLIECD
jgi:type II secretory pathway pseudopilin PulG